jgi:PQQ enzyme-like repeat protein
MGAETLIPGRSNHRLGDNNQLARPGSLEHDLPKPFIGSVNGSGAQDPKDQQFGHITAVDADNGKALWKYDADTSMVASVTPTAGGLLLTGDTKGNFDGAADACC